VPNPAPAERGRFLKLGARRYLVISIVMAAGIVLTDAAGHVARARIAVGACSPVARRLPDLEAALAGQPLAAAPDLVAPEHLAPLAPIDDIRASGNFRHVAALELLRDLLAGFAEPQRRAA
jgi:N-methylhydantoinase B